MAQSNPVNRLAVARHESVDPFAMQLALSRVHARLVPMRRGHRGYELHDGAHGWFELPAGRGFAGYGLGRALRMLLDVLRGLTALHDTFDAVGEPFAHGEVALPHLRVDNDGVCRVVPLTPRHSSATASALLPEAMGYLAPERLLGEALDPRADVFSAGVLLWEAMSGRRLFEETSALAIIDRLMGEKLPMPQLPPELAWAIPLKSVAARALSVDPYQRFADCAELATAIALVSRERVASHGEIASFFGAPPRSTERRQRDGSAVTPTPSQRVVPSQSSTFPSVDSTIASSRRPSTLAPLGPTRSLRSTTLTSLGTPLSVAEPLEAAPEGMASPESLRPPASSRRPPPLPLWAQVQSAPPPSPVPPALPPILLQSTLSALVSAPADSEGPDTAPEAAAVSFRRPARRALTVAGVVAVGAVIACVAWERDHAATGAPSAALAALPVATPAASPAKQSSARTAEPASLAANATPPTAAPSVAPANVSAPPNAKQSNGVRATTRGAKSAAGAKASDKDYGI